ncbi:MAG: cell wall hydrolase [Brevundimonas sp.]
MTAQDGLAAATSSSAAWVAGLWRRLRPERAWAHSLAPCAAAVLGALIVLAGAGGVWVQVRLDAMAASASGPDAAPEAPALIVPTATALHAEDYTLSPDALQALSPEGAMAWNAALPISTLPILAARPFVMAPDDLEAYGRALDCLTAAIYYEAANEPARGQAAVAQVVINRMRHPAYPKTVCGVVFEGSERRTGCQFSFTCDGSLDRVARPEGWARARAVAAAALNGAVAPEVGMATHYHADYVAPFWAPKLVKIGKIGAHIFYRWTGTWGLPLAFSGSHAGPEPLLVGMTPILTSVEIRAPEPPPALVRVEDVQPVAPVASPPEVATREVAAQAAAVLAPIVPQPAAATPPPSHPAPALSDPLARPDTGAARRRPRIAAPSGW